MGQGTQHVPWRRSGPGPGRQSGHVPFVGDGALVLTVREEGAELAALPHAVHDHPDGRHPEWPCPWAYPVSFE